MGGSLTALHDLLIFPETTTPTVKQEHDSSGFFGFVVFFSLIILPQSFDNRKLYSPALRV